jgi:hypothetical protein
MYLTQSSFMALSVDIITPAALKTIIATPSDPIPVLGVTIFGFIPNPGIVPESYNCAEYVRNSDLNPLGDDCPARPAKGIINQH